MYMQRTVPVICNHIFQQIFICLNSNRTSRILFYVYFYVTTYINTIERAGRPVLDFHNSIPTDSFAADKIAGSNYYRKKYGNKVYTFHINWFCGGKNRFKCQSFCNFDV